MTRAVPAAAIALCKSFEQCRLVAYDTDGAGIPTIGYGHVKTVSKADVGVKTITQDQADILLEADFADAAATVQRQIGDDAINAMTDGQYGAIADFTFNTGSMGPTLVSLLKAKKFDSVPAQLARYVYAHNGGQLVKLNGLVRRRNAEIELWSTGEPGAVDATPSSADTRTTSTPPATAAQAAKPLSHQTSFLAACGTAVCTAGAAAQPVVQTVSDSLSQVSNQIAPFTDNSHVQAIHNAILGGLAALAALSVVLLWLKQRAIRNESDGAPNNVAKPTAPSSVGGFS